MTNRIPDYLKLFIEDVEETTGTTPLSEFERLWAIFPEVTGLRLNVTTHENKNQLSFPWSDANVLSYKVSIEPTKRAKLYSMSAAHEMEEAFGLLLNALGETRTQLRRREAELAASIPVVSVDEDGKHLAERLDAILRGTTEMLQCSGAGLYLLDETTTALKLRSHFGLGDAALLQPPRPLEESMADVEALSGHAVVIEDVRPSHWQVPEKSKSAMCIPVSSATSLLGTMWVFSDEVRDFTPTEQNLAEITAGRLASDLERAVLTQEVRNLRGTSSTTESDSNNHSDVAIDRPANEETVWSEGRLTRFAPYIDGWDVADERTNSQAVGDFSHWHIVDDNRLHLAIGAAHGMMNKRLSSVAFQATHAAHTSHDPGIREIFEMCNQSLWTSSIEGEASSMFHGTLDPKCGSLEYALAGGVFGWVIRPHGWEPLLKGKSVLGVDCEMSMNIQRTMLMPGDILVAMSSPYAERSFERDNRMNQIAEKILRSSHLSACELSELASQPLKEMGNPGDSMAVLIAKRDES